jgi:hypothetical protein
MTARAGLRCSRALKVGSNDGRVQVKLCFLTQFLDVRFRKLFTPNSERGPMNNRETCHWETSYMLAILETDEAEMHCRLYEAIAAMEQRRLSPISSEEDFALTAAEAGVQMLLSERIQKVA